MNNHEVEKIITEFVRNSPENTLVEGDREPAWGKPLVGFSLGDDPIFVQFKDAVGHFHFTPVEIFNLTFPETPAEPDELTVISWVLPQTNATKADNRAQDFYPADRWVRARFRGEDFNVLLRKHVVDELTKAGIQSVAPQLSPEWKMEQSPEYWLASRWSERHAAHASGLGTFGLCDGLITPLGKAHRVGSVVARLTLEPTERPYDNHRAYCLYFQDESCLVCVKRCPVGAISEKGHDKPKCWEHAGKTCREYVKKKLNFDGYGCGLCQTGVPCESGIPVKGAA